MSVRCTVLMPVRNGAEFLDEALASVSAQSFRDFDILIVDDHSTDHSAAIIEAWAERLPIAVLPNPGQGIVAALNIGLEHCTSAYVARMDCDDRMRPERLKRQIDLLASQADVAACGTQVAVFPRRTMRSGYREYERWLNTLSSPEQIAAARFVESPLAHPAVMIRRDALLRHGGYRDGDFPEDYELWLRLIDRGEALANVPEVLLDWRDQPQRTSRCDPRYRAEAFDRLRAEYLGRELARRQIGEVIIWGAGRRSRRRVRRLVDQGVDIVGWIDIDPRKVGNTLWGRPIHPPEWLAGESGLVLSYVTNHGARDQITDFLVGVGRRAGDDFLLVG